MQIAKTCALMLTGIVVSAAHAGSSLQDPELGTISAITSSTPQDGANISAIYDLTRFMLTVAPQAKLQAEHVTAQTATSHGYSIVPVNAPFSLSGGAITATGTWTVSRDGAVVCQSCIGWANLSANGYWISIAATSNLSGPAWNLTLVGTPQ